MIRHALRALRSQPGVSGGIVLSLALAVGANTAIFGLADEILWRPLPVDAPDRVVAVYGLKTTDATVSGSSYLDYQDYREGSVATFEALAAYLRAPLRLEQPATPAMAVGAEFVSSNYFDGLGLRPIQGRTFTSTDERSARPVALISERLARRVGVLTGSPVKFNGYTVTVIGIIPAAYKGILLDWADPPDVWLPLPMIEQILPITRAAGFFSRREARSLMIVGKLRAGVSPEVAGAVLRTVATRLEAAYPVHNARVSTLVLPAQQARVWPSARPIITRTLFMFGGAVALVLLLACTNIANLLLERAAARRKEIAIRLAIGATRASLIRQLMTESLIVAIAGSVVGLLFARVLSWAVAAAPRPFGRQLALDLPLDLRGLAFTALLAFLTALVFGLMPALHASRCDLVPALKGTQKTSPGFRLFSLRHALVVAQVAISLVLLVMGGLFTRSLYESYRQNPGFDANKLLIVPLDFTARTAPGAQNRELMLQAAERAAILPGVQSASLAQLPPFGPMRLRVAVATGTDATIDSEANDIGAGYFQTVGISLLAGRDIEARDLLADARTVVINETLARHLFSSTAAVGRFVRVASVTGPGDPLEIVGVVRTAKYHSVWEAPIPMLYRPLQRERLAQTALLIRTHVPAPSSAPVSPAIRELVQQLDPTLPMAAPLTWADQIQQAVAPQRAAAALLGMFSISALVLASVGLYSVLAYAVAQRTREIGVRIALGAEPAHVRRQVIGRGVLLAGVGLGIGVFFSSILAPLFATLLPGIDSTDPITLGGVSMVLLTVAVIASVRPAQRASRVDPLKAIRAE